MPSHHVIGIFFYASFLNQRVFLSQEENNAQKMKSAKIIPFAHCDVVLIINTMIIIAIIIDFFRAIS